MFSFIAWFTRSKPATTVLPMSTADVVLDNRPSFSQRIQAAWQSFVMAIIVIFSCGMANGSDVEHGVQASATQSSSFYAPEFRSKASTSVPSIPSLPSSYSYQSRIQTERRGLRADAHRSANSHTGSSPYAHYAPRSTPLHVPTRLNLDEIVSMSHVGNRVILRTEPTKVTQPPIIYEPGRLTQTSRPRALSAANRASLELPSMSRGCVPVAEPITPPPSPKPFSNTPISFPAPRPVDFQRPRSQFVVGDVHEGVCLSPKEPTISGIDIASDESSILNANTLRKETSSVHDLTLQEPRASVNLEYIPEIHTVPTPNSSFKTFNNQDSNAKSDQVSVEQGPVPSHNLKSCVLPCSDIPIIRVHRPESSISEANPVEIPPTIEDARSMASSSVSLFDSSLDSSSSAVDSTEVPDVNDCCRSSVSSASIYSQDDLPHEVAVQLPETNREEAESIQVARGPVGPMPDVLEGYHDESNELQMSDDEDDSDACSIISDGGVAQEEYRMSLKAFDKETRRLTAEFRRKSQMTQPTNSIQERSNELAFLDLDVKSMVAGDSSLSTENSASTLSVESDQFQYDNNNQEDESPEGVPAIPLARSSSHLALLAALGLLTHQAPGKPVTTSGSETGPRPSTAASTKNPIKSNIKYDDHFNYASAGEDSSATRSALSAPKEINYRGNTAPLRITIPDPSEVAHTSALRSTDSSSSTHSASESSSDINVLLPTPPRTPVEPTRRYQTLNRQDNIPSKAPAPCSSSGIPPRKAAAPILPNQENKRETSSTTSSRLKHRSTRATILDPDTVPPVPPLPSTLPESSLQPPKSTKPHSSSEPSAPRLSRPSPPKSGPSARPTFDHSSHTPIPNRSLRALRPLASTPRTTPIGIESVSEITSTGAPSRGELPRSRTQTPSVLTSNATRITPPHTLKLEQATSKLNHAGHGSTRSQRAVELRNGLITPAGSVDNPSETRNGNNISTPRSTQLAPTTTHKTPISTSLVRTGTVNPSPRVDKTNRRRGLRPEDVAAFVVMPETSSRSNPAASSTGRVTSKSQTSNLRGPNHHKVQSTNVWI